MAVHRQCPEDRSSLIVMSPDWAAKLSIDSRTRLCLPSSPRFCTSMSNEGFHMRDNSVGGTHNHLYSVNYAFITAAVPMSEELDMAIDHGLGSQYA